MNFVIGSEPVRIGLRPDTEALCDGMKPEEDEDFTTASSSRDESSRADSKDEESFIVTLVKEVEGPLYTIKESPNKDWKQKLIASKLEHLEEELRKKILNELDSSEIWNLSLED